MPRAFKAMLVVFALIVGLIFLWLAAPAHAHEWYTGRNDPASTLSCCGGSDCAPVPLTEDWVQPVADGFHVILSKEEAQIINPHAASAINTVIPWSRVMVLTGKYDGPPAFYHICIVSNEVRCLFAVPST